MNNNKTPTIPLEKDIDISQNENLKKNLTIPVRQSDDKDISRQSTTLLDNSSTDESIFDNSLYISDNKLLELKIKKEDRLDIESGESILFKNKVSNNEKKEVEVLIKVFKNIDIESDAKKLENRKKILELVYEKRKEVEENNLARVISYGKVIANSKEYFAEVYRYYSGGDLLDKIPLKYEEIKTNIIPSLLKALRYLHSHNIVHRDIKPENIYTDENGKIYLGDFGIARYIGEELIDYDEEKIGTPGYTAPELLLLNTGRVLKESDYYSLGQTLYTLYTGELMYKSIINNKELFHNDILRDKYYGFSKFKEHKLLEALIKGLLKYSVSERFNDEDIKKFLEGNESLKRKVNMEDNNSFDSSLNIYGEKLWSKSEIYNFLIKNKDKIDEILNKEVLSEFFERNKMPTDRNAIQEIEENYLKGRNSFEKKYQIFKLYRFFKEENIFIWDNEEIKTYKDITTIPAQDLKKLLEKGVIKEFLTDLNKEFLTDFNSEPNFIKKLDEIRKYPEDIILCILNIYFDTNNNGKKADEYTYQGKNLNSLITEYIETKDKNNLLTPLLSLLYIYGYPNIDENNLLLILEENAKENSVKIKIREEYLKSKNILTNDNISISDRYKSLEDMIQDIKNHKYEATGEESKKILANICSYEIFPNRMNINEIRESINNFEYEYKRFQTKFEDNPYAVMNKTYTEDSIITRYCNKYLRTEELSEYTSKFKEEVSQKKSSFDELKPDNTNNERIPLLFLVSVISFILAYAFSRTDLYIKYITVDNSVIKLLLPQFRYLFYSIAIYFLVKAMIFLILTSTLNHKAIEKKYNNLYDENFGKNFDNTLDYIYYSITSKEDVKFEQDYSETNEKLDKLKEKYDDVIVRYEKLRKIQLFLPVISMMLVLFFVFKNLNIFNNEYFLFKLYGYFLSVAIIYVLATERKLKTLYYSKNIFLALSIISIVGLYLYQYSTFYTLDFNLGLLENLKLHKVGLIGVSLLVLLNLNLQGIIKTNKSYFFYILLIPGIIVPLTFLTLNLNLKWYYFYFLLALPGAIGIVSYRDHKHIKRINRDHKRIKRIKRIRRIIAYLMYKIPFALLGYSLITMTGTPMFKLTGFFNAFVMLFMGDIFVGIVLVIVLGIIGTIL